MISDGDSDSDDDSDSSKHNHPMVSVCVFAAMYTELGALAGQGSLVLPSRSSQPKTKTCKHSFAAAYVSLSPALCFLPVCLSAVSAMCAVTSLLLPHLTATRATHFNAVLICRH